MTTKARWGPGLGADQEKNLDKGHSLVNTVVSVLIYLHLMIILWMCEVKLDEGYSLENSSCYQKRFLKSVNACDLGSGNGCSYDTEEQATKRENR